MNLSYDKLSDNYPVDKDGKKIVIGGGCKKYENQCAIRLSRAIYKATNKNIFASYTLMTGSGAVKGQVCTADEKAHARGAEELAKFLSKKFKRPKKYKPPSKAKVKGEKGIIFFRNIKGFRNGLGDHIDLWDGTATKTGEYFSEAKEVWFWSFK